MTNGKCGKMLSMQPQIKLALIMQRTTAKTSEQRTRGYLHQSDVSREAFYNL